MTNRKHWAALQASTSVRRWGESVERCLPSFLHKQTRTNGQITFSTAIEMQRKAISIQTPCSLIAWAAQSEDCVHMTLRALYCNSKKHNGSSYLLGLFLLFYQPFTFHSHLFICNPLNNWFIIYFWCAPFLSFALKSSQWFWRVQVSRTVCWCVYSQCCLVIWTIQKRSVR